MKKSLLLAFAGLLFAGCTSKLDEKICLPPDVEKAHTAMQAYKAYAESLWYQHYHKDEKKSPPTLFPPSNPKLPPNGKKLNVPVSSNFSKNTCTA